MTFTIMAMIEHEIKYTDIKYAIRRMKDGDGRLSIWGEPLMKAYAKVSPVSFVPPISWVRTKDYLIFGSRILNKMTDEGKSNSHVILSARDPLRLTAMPGSFSYDLKAYSEIYHATFDGSDQGLLNLQRRMVKLIRKTKAKVFVANSTTDPINRLWLYVARQLGLKTICLQHGVYSNALPDYASEEDIVDRFIALDDTQASIIAKNIDPKKIVSLGKRGFTEWSPPAGELKICFVGEDWERYGLVDLKMILIKSYRELAGSFRREDNISFCYKPHPSEQLLFGIDKEMPLLPRKKIDEPDVYIGFASSLLREMAARGKLVIQIVDPRLKSDCFADSGYCLSFDNDHHLITKILSTVRHNQVMPSISEGILDALLC